MRPSAAWTTAASAGPGDVQPCGKPINHSANLTDTTRNRCQSAGETAAENAGSKRRHDGSSRWFLLVRIGAAQCVTAAQRIEPYARTVGSSPTGTHFECLRVARPGAPGTCAKRMSRFARCPNTGFRRAQILFKEPLQVPKQGKGSVAGVAAASDASLKSMSDSVSTHGPGRSAETPDPPPDSHSSEFSIPSESWLPSRLISESWQSSPLDS